jgi:putative transposase
MEIRQGRHVVYLLHAHLVFVTKRRGKVFRAEHLKRLEPIFRSVCADFEMVLKEFNGGPDHVNLLVNYRQRSVFPSWSTASKASPRGA